MLLYVEQSEQCLPCSHCSVCCYLAVTLWEICPSFRKGKKGINWLMDSGNSRYVFSCGQLQLVVGLEFCDGEDSEAH